MRSTIKKWGNSAAVRLLASVLEEMHLAIDAEIDVRVEDGRIIIEPVPAPKYDLDRLLARITPENLHEEVSFGPAAGKEAL